MKPLACRAALEAFLCCALALSVFSQADVSTATVKGKVVDAQGAAVPGATVTIKNLAQGVSRSTVSETGGEFQMSLLRPGGHEITVEAPGFGKQILKDVRLTVGQVATYEIKLEVAAVRTEIIVSVPVSLVETERTQQANTIESEQIQNLPNLGRSFTNYVFTLPGVASSDAPRVQGGTRFNFGSSGFSIGGSNGRTNLITIDGGENEYGSGQQRIVNLSPDAVQEFQVNRNAFAAEFGFTAGTAVNVVTRSGTNDFHGSAYAYFRSQKTSARNYFDRSDRKSFDQQVYPGVTFGGPIRRDRVFFFTSYEMLKSDSSRFRSYTASSFLRPSAAQSSVLDRLDASSDANVRRISSDVRNTLTTSQSSWPTTFKMLRDNEGSFVSPTRLHNWTTRLDYNLGARDSISARFSLTHNDTDQLGTTNTNAPTTRNILLFRDYTTLVTWNHIFGPRVVSQTRFQISPKDSARQLPSQPDSTSLLIGGFGNFGRPFTDPFNTWQNRYQAEEILSWTRNKHMLKFGASYRPVQYRVRNELWFSGEWTFSSGAFPLVLGVKAADQAAFVGAAGTLTASNNLTSLQAFNLGLPASYRQGFNNPEWADTAQYLGLFAQDTWKIHPRFTLDYGGRIDYDGEPAPVPQNSYFSPRLGFAWELTRDHKTVLRGGGGVFYSPVFYQVVYVTNLLNDSGTYINQILRSALDATNSAAVIWGAGIAAGKLPFKALAESDLTARGVATGRGAANRVLFQTDPDYKNNYSIQGSIGIQRQLASNLGLEVAYQSYRGVHIQKQHQINYRESATPNSRGPAFGPAYTRIDPTIAQLNNYESTGNSSYHGMTVSLTKRASNHMQFQVNYTFSKAIDDQTDYNSAFAAAFPTRLNLERAVSSFDLRHNFVASGVFQSPLQRGAGHNVLARALADITLSPIISLRSGIPFSLTTGADTNGDTHAFNDRLIYIGRNTGIGPSFYSTNIRLNKTFFIARDRGVRAEFIVEVTNLFNHTNFSSVNDVLGVDPASADYNTGTFRLKGDKSRSVTQPLGFMSAFDPRRVQFGLRVAF